MKYLSEEDEQHVAEDYQGPPEASLRFAGAHGSVNLVEAIKAAWRLRYYGYHDWALAGGIDECRHGIAAGIHCARCDELLLNEAYKQVSSPNDQAHPTARANRAGHRRPGQILLPNLRDALPHRARPANNLQERIHHAGQSPHRHRCSRQSPGKSAERSKLCDRRGTTHEN